jgi:lysozyme
VKVPLTQGQFDALTDVTFNVGAGNFASSTLLAVPNAGHYNEVPAQLLRWIYDSAGTAEPGLKTRRENEAAMFSRGIYP